MLPQNISLHIQRTMRDRKLLPFIRIALIPSKFLCWIRTIGHFTIVANDRNIAIGCAASNYVNKDGFDTYLVACNYATTNFEGEPVYKACDEAASDCTTGTNPDYPALCSADEDIGQDENDY